MSSSASIPSHPQNDELLRKLEKLTQDNAILDKQLTQAETAAELAELACIPADNETVIGDLRLEVKQSKHRWNKASAALEEVRKKSVAVAVAALEDENWFLKGVVEMAKAAVEKAVKEKEEAVTEKLRLKRANDSIIYSDTVRFRALEKRVVALEAVVSNSNLPVQESTGQTAPVGSQETTDHAVVYGDSD